LFCNMLAELRATQATAATATAIDSPPPEEDAAA
jgi:hypothetical protein